MSKHNNCRQSVQTPKWNWKLEKAARRFKRGTNMNVPLRLRMGQVRRGRLGLTDLYQHTHHGGVLTQRVSVCIERWAVSEPSSPAHPSLHISPFSSNHFLPFGPLLSLMQLFPHSFLFLSSSSSDHLFPLIIFCFTCWDTIFFGLLFSSVSVISASHVQVNSGVSTIVCRSYCSSLFARTWLSPLFCSLAISLP